MQKGFGEIRGWAPPPTERSLQEAMLGDYDKSVSGLNAFSLSPGPVSCRETLLHLKRNREYDYSDMENLSGFISSIEKSLFQQLHKYPQSTLKDVYKSFFQDEYGPGHLLEDPERARTAFDQELASMKSRGRREFEPCGRGLHFHRAPLDLVKDGIIEADEYFDAFFDGASEFMLPDKALWEQKWLALLEVLTPMRRSIKNFEQDSLEIAKTLERGHWVMHHSGLYCKAYDPHYRIIRVTDPRFSILQVNP